jgi:hypothetical protein
MAGFQGLGAGLGSFIGAAAAEGSAQSEEKIIDELLSQSMDEYGKIQPAVFERLVAERLGPTELSKIQEDPRLKAAQMNALSRLEQVGAEGGMTIGDRARQHQIEGQIGQQANARKASLLSNARQRGISGSGLSLAAQMGNNQATTQALANGGFDIHAQAADRALQGMMKAGQLGGQIRGQDFDQAARKADAQDRINRYENEMRMKVAQSNNGYAQQGFENRLGLANNRNKVRGGMAQRAQNKADGHRRRGEAAGRAIGTIAGGAADAGIAYQTGGMSALGSFGGKEDDDE